MDVHATVAVWIVTGTAEHFPAVALIAAVDGVDAAVTAMMTMDISKTAHMHYKTQK